MIEIAITDNQATLPNDHARWDSIVRQILHDAGYINAEISIAVVDDPTIHQLNQTHLQHDYATDVLSFVLEQTPDTLEGEVIVSFETAISRSTEFGLSAEHELTLYIVHGVLHLLGYDHIKEKEREEMEALEIRLLSQLGVENPYE